MEGQREGQASYSIKPEALIYIPKQTAARNSAEEDNLSSPIARARCLKRPATPESPRHALFKARFNELKNTKALQENNTKRPAVFFGLRLQTLISEFKSKVSEFPELSPDSLQPWLEYLVDYIHANSKDYQHVRISDAEHWVASNFWITAPLPPRKNDQEVVQIMEIQANAIQSNLPILPDSMEVRSTSSSSSGSSSENSLETSDSSDTSDTSKSNSGPEDTGNPTLETSNNTTEPDSIPKILFQGKTNLHEISFENLQTLVKESLNIMKKRIEDTVQISSPKQSATDIASALAGKTSAKVVLLDMLLSGLDELLKELEASLE